MTGPLRLATATDDDPARGTGTPATGPVPGTGTGERTGGPMAAPVWPALAASPLGPRTDLGRLAEMLAGTDELIAGARSAVAAVEAVIGRPVTLPTHVPGLAPLVDPALRRAA